MKSAFTILERLFSTLLYKENPSLSKVEHINNFQWLRGRFGKTNINIESNWRIRNMDNIFFDFVFPYYLCKFKDNIFYWQLAQKCYFGLLDVLVEAVGTGWFKFCTGFLFCRYASVSSSTNCKTNFLQYSRSPRTYLKSTIHPLIATRSNM